MKNDQNRDPIFVLNPRSISIVIAACLTAGFFIFIAGYFLGQKRAAEQFTYRIDQESLADQIYSSVCGLYDNHSENEEEDGAEKAEDDSETASDAAVAHAQIPEAVPVVPENIPAPAVQTLSEKAYKAQLVGFGSKNMAEKCVARLTKLGYPVTMQERVSANRQGKKVCWYQIETHRYSDKKALLADVEKIKKAEHIRDVRITQA